MYVYIATMTQHSLLDLQFKCPSCGRWSAGLFWYCTCVIHRNMSQRPRLQPKTASVWSNFYEVFDVRALFVNIGFCVIAVSASASSVTATAKVFQKPVFATMITRGVVYGQGLYCVDANFSMWVRKPCALWNICICMPLICFAMSHYVGIHKLEI